MLINTYNAYTLYIFKNFPGLAHNTQSTTRDIHKLQCTTEIQLKIRAAMFSTSIEYKRQIMTEVGKITIVLSDSDAEKTSC